MATPCPAGYIPDESSGLCRPSSTANGLGQGASEGASGVASLGTPPPPPSFTPSLSTYGAQGEGQGQALGSSDVKASSPGMGGVATSFLTNGGTGGNTPTPGGEPPTSGGSGGGGGAGTTPPANVPGCDCVHFTYETGHPCFQKCKDASNPSTDPAKSPCPGGATAEPGSGACFCGDGECRDVVSGECRGFNPNREKVNETDDITRSTGGGRGYCRQLDPGQQGQGGGGGGGATGGNSGMSQYGDIWSQIQGLLKSPSRYTPEVMAQLLGLAKQREAGQNQASTDASTADQVRRGIFSSPLGAALSQQAKQGAATDFNKASGDLSIAKVNADAQDKMFAVQASMQWVQMMMQQNQFDANLKLAYARLLQEWQMLQAQLNDPLRLTGPLL